MISLADEVCEALKGVCAQVSYFTRFLGDAALRRLAGERQP